MESEIKILDCTLRDGGYINDWTFGKENIRSIIDNLALAGIDYIECGFLKECKINPDKTFFKSPNDISNTGQNYTFMVNYGEYDISNFGECKNPNIKIRVAFKKHNKDEALKYIDTLVKSGWSVFANPMSTNTYSKEELEDLINKINKIKPYGLSIVDTLGNMYEKDVKEIFDFIDKYLAKRIAIGFHSHNSMQLSFSNTKALLRKGINREVVIDSCVYGMGRGAGNLCTELITKYLNDNYARDYKISPILKIIELIKPFYEKKPWGYSTPYYIAAIHGCHPNYAGFFVEKGVSDENINQLINLIPADKKLSFDINLANFLIQQF